MGLLDSIKKYNEKHLVKNEAIASFLKDGFPTTKHEEWKYTSLKKVVSPDYLIEENSLEISSKEIESCSLNIGSKIVFVNGDLVE